MVRLSQDLQHAQETFVQLLDRVRTEDKAAFLQWLNTNYVSQTFDSGLTVDGTIAKERHVAERLLDDIAADLRCIVPLNCLSQDEIVFFPQQGKNSDLSPATTVHVDSFLYATDEDVDVLFDQLGVSRNYCLECGSWKTAPLDFISHSMSRMQVHFIFTKLLHDMPGKLVLDVGSRLGTVLWGGYVYCPAARLIGVEINAFFCELQCQIISRYGLGDRIQVLCSDICTLPNLLDEVDVVVLNNVFEFFCPPETQKRIWSFLCQHLRRKGTLLITIPSIYESVNNLQFETPHNIAKWLTEVPIIMDPADEELNDLHLYCVQ